MTAQPKPTAAEYTPTTQDVRAAWIDAHRVPAWGGRIDAEGRPRERVREFDRWLAEHDAQVAAEALRRKARAYRQAEREGYVFLGESDRVPWETVVRDLDSDAARVAAGEEP